MRFLLLFLLLYYNISFSHHKIYSPQVEEGRQSFEWRGHHDIDDRNEFNKLHHHVFRDRIFLDKLLKSELEPCV